MSKHYIKAAFFAPVTTAVILIIFYVLREVRESLGLGQKVHVLGRI